MRYYELQTRLFLECTNPSRLHSILSGKMPFVTTDSEVKAGLEGKGIKDVINISSHNLMVFTCFDDANIRVFENNDGKLVRIFENHTSPSRSDQHVSMVHLFGDVLCSADNAGSIITWQAHSGHVLGKFKGPEDADWSLTKLNDAEVALVFGTKRMIILKHSKGRHIAQVRELHVGDIDDIYGMDGFGNTVVAVGTNAAEIWDSEAGTMTASFKLVRSMDIVRISDDFIACGNTEGAFLNIHKNKDDYGVVISVDLKQYFSQHERTSNPPNIHDITLINSRLMLVTCGSGVVIVSLPSGNVVACFEFRNQLRTFCATILRNGRIYAAGERAHCFTFQQFPSWYIRDDLKRYAGKIYKEPDARPYAAVIGAPSNDEDVQSVSGSRNPLNKENEDANVGTQVRKPLKEIEKELEGQKRMNEKMKVEREIRKVEMRKSLAKLEVQKEDMRKMKLELERRKEDMRKSLAKLNQKKMERERRTEDTKKSLVENKKLEHESRKPDVKKATTTLGAPEEYMKQMEERMRAEQAIQIEEMKKELAQFDAQKEDMKNMKLERIIEKEEMKKAFLKFDAQKEDMKKMEESMKLQREILKEEMRKSMAKLDAQQEYMKKMERMMRDKMKREVEKLTEEMRHMEEKMEEKMKVQREEHKEEMKKMEDQMKLDMNILKVAVVKNPPRAEFNFWSWLGRPCTWITCAGRAT